MVNLNKAVLFTLIQFIISAVCPAVFAQEKTIDDYIKTATNNSPLIKDLNNQVLNNRLDSSIIRSNYKPQIGVNTSGSYAPVIRGFGYDEVLSNGKTFSALLTVNQILMGNGRLKNELRNLEIHSDSINNAVILSQQDIRKNIISQYIAAYTGQKQLELDQGIHQLLKQEELILKKLTQNNVYKQVDYLIFLVTMQQQELQMKQNQIEALNNIAGLNYLAGIVSTDSVKLAEPKLNLNVAQTSKGSIFLERYRLDSIRIQNNKKRIDFNYRPRAGIYGDAGYNSSFIEQAYRNFGTSIGFTVSVPIYDGHQRKLQYSKLDIQDITRTNYRNYFLKQVEQQNALLRQQLDQYEGLFSKINEQLRFTESLIKVDGKLLQTGDVTMSDYIIAIRNYLEAQRLLRQTNSSRLELINQLNYWNQ